MNDNKYLFLGDSYEDQLLLRRIVLECNYKFPEALKSSGLMYYLGKAVTQSQFKKMAKEMK